MVCTRLAAWALSALTSSSGVYSSDSSGISELWWREPRTVSAGSDDAGVPFYVDSRGLFGAPGRAAKSLRKDLMTAAVGRPCA